MSVQHGPDICTTCGVGELKWLLGQQRKVKSYPWSVDHIPDNFPALTCLYCNETFWTVEHSEYLSRMLKEIEKCVYDHENDNEARLCSTVQNEIFSLMSKSRPLREKVLEMSTLFSLVHSGGPLYENKKYESVGVLFGHATGLLDQQILTISELLLEKLETKVPDRFFIAQALRHINYKIDI